MSKEELIPIGRITGAHGIRGEVKLAPYGPLDGLPWETLYLEGRGSGAEARKVLSHRVHKGSYLVVFEGVVDRNGAEALSGREVSVPRSELPEPEEDEFYHSDLIGMSVETVEGKYIGVVESIFATGGNDVIEASGPLGDVLIPVIENVIIRIEPDKRKITVRLMEGLLPEE